MDIRHIIIIILLTISCNNGITETKEAEVNNKVLFICTSESTYNDYVNGTYMQEIAIPINEFHQRGIEIDILSPKGGEIPIYHKFDTSEALQLAIESEYYRHKISHSIKPEDIKIEDYSAIIIPGGYSQFLDLHKNEIIKDMIVRHYEGSGIIGTIGHGTALLAPLKLSSGKYLVKDVTMTCFPNWNEKNIMVEANKGQVLPFFMQDELLKNGALVKIYDHDKKINYEVCDWDKKVVSAAFADGGKYVSHMVMEMILSE